MWGAGRTTWRRAARRVDEKSARSYGVNERGPRAALVLLMVLPLLAGCFDRGSASLNTPAARLPDGSLLDGTDPVDANGTARSFRWAGTIPGPAVQGNGLADALNLPLTFPGTAPLWLEANLTTSGDADLALRIVDEYGRERCAVGESRLCVIREVAQLGWTRAWRVELSAVDAEGPVDVELALTLRLHEGRMVAPIAPAGLDRIEPFEAIAEDGTALRGHVYVPRGAGPFATVLEFSPYFNGNAASDTADATIEVGDRTTIKWASHGPLGVLLDAGFAVAMVNLRGTGASGGCQSWFDPAVDGRDAATIIQALADSPWSNGNVGMVGVSWHGYSQYAALLDPPAALKALAPSSAILDHWTLWTRYGAPLNTDNLARARGLPLASDAAFYAAFTLDNGGYLGPAQDVGAPGYVEHVPDIAGRNTAPCPEYAEQAAAWAALGATGDDADFFRERAAGGILANATIPVLATNGLLPYPYEGHIHQIDGLWPLLPEGSVLVVGPWAHGFPDQGPADRYERMLLDWFDQHLRGGSALVAPGVRYQSDDFAWHEAAAWPPHATEVPLWLSDATLVSDPAEVVEAEQIFLSREGERPTHDACPFQAIYATPPLRQDVLLAGNAQIEITLTSTAPDGNLAVYLWAVDEEVTCDAIDGGEGQHVLRAVTDLRHRGNLRTGEPFLVGAPGAISMLSQPFAARVPAGSRLVLAVGGDSGSEVVEKAFLPAITVHSDGVSGLTLPVVEGALAFA